MAPKTQLDETIGKRGQKRCAVSYNEFKEHEGQRYTGMKVG